MTRTQIFLTLGGITLLLALCMIAVRRDAPVSAPPPSSLTANATSLSFHELPPSGVHPRAEVHSDFTGTGHLAELKAAIQKKNRVEIDLVLRRLVVHLEEHPANIPGVIAFLKTDHFKGDDGTSALREIERLIERRSDAECF